MRRAGFLGVLAVTVAACHSSSSSSSPDAGVPAGGDIYVSGTVAAVPDGGFVLVGNYAASASSGTDLVVAKLDAAGSLVRQQRISYDDGATAVYAAGAVAGSDGVAVFATAQNTMTSTAILLKLDLDGNLVWRHGYDYATQDEAAAIATSPDGGYLLAGLSSVPWLIKTDATGNLVWQEQLAGEQPGDAQPVVLRPTSDGHVVLVQSIGLASSSEKLRAQLVELDGSGAITWQTQLGGPDTDFIADVAELPDHSLLAAGGTFTYGDGERAIWLLSFAADGTLTRQLAIGGGGQDEGALLTVGNDGSVAVVGQGYVTGGDYDAYVAALDGSGNVTASTPISPINLSGGVTRTSTGGVVVFYDVSTTTQSVQWVVASATTALGPYALSGPGASAVTTCEASAGATFSSIASTASPVDPQLSVVTTATVTTGSPSINVHALAATWWKAACGS